MDWGTQLTKFITAAEARVAVYKVLLAALRHDPELLTMLREDKNSEERYLKRLRREKTYWNEGRWEAYLLDKDCRP